MTDTLQPHQQRVVDEKKELVSKIDNTYFGGFGRTLVAHPSLLRGLR